MTKSGKNRLMYARPAAEWTEALPLGNGRLGAMVFGGIDKERIALNEDSLWYGGPVDRLNPDAGTHFKKVRALVREGRIAEAERLALVAMAGTPESPGHYLPLGDLNLFFVHDGVETIPRYLEVINKPEINARFARKAALSGYERDLELETAIAGVRYSIGEVSFSREMLASAVDQMIAMRLTADKPGALSFSARFSRGAYSGRSGKFGEGEVFMAGNCGGPGGHDYAAVAEARLVGAGTVSVLGDTIVVQGASEAVLFVTAESGFRHTDPLAACADRLRRVSGKSWEEIRRGHIKNYKELFNRVSLDLGDPGSDLPTDERLRRYAEGAADPGLESLYFQYGRYLLISSSRPGTLPANLQGIWNDQFAPKWGSKYTININTEMNYWHAETCALEECHLPLFDLIERMRPHGRKTAREMYGCRGFVAHHNTDIYGDTAPVDRWNCAMLWPTGAAWLCLHIWEHFDFTGDIEFLKAEYPAMREAAEFLLDYLTEDSRGRLVTCPSVSPENSYYLPNGEIGSLCSGPSMDSQIAYALFIRCERAAEILGVDDDFRSDLRTARERLPKPEIGSKGTLMEWAEDYEEIEPGHRHISHLFALYPDNRISREHSPELARAAQATLERRLANGGGHTGWSRAWLINMWARLDDGDRAYDNLRALLSKSTLPNLLDNHPPFQIDGNFGGTAGMGEMLARSVPDFDRKRSVVQLLPALPTTWAAGRCAGLKVRGGWTVDIEWSGGRLVGATLKAPKFPGESKTREGGGKLTVRYAAAECEVSAEAGDVVNLGADLRIVI